MQRNSKPEYGNRNIKTIESNRDHTNRNGKVPYRNVCMNTELVWNEKSPKTFYLGIAYNAGDSQAFSISYYSMSFTPCAFSGLQC